MYLVLALIKVFISVFARQDIAIFVAMKIFSTICKFGLRIVLMVLVVQFGQSLIVKSSENHEGEVVITGISATTGK